MPYSNKEDVKFYGQFSSGQVGSIGPDENESYQKAIRDADGMIDDYCNVPEGFFSPSGIAIVNEYLNGTDIAHTGSTSKTFAWYSGGTSHLTFKHHPVLSVTTLEEETGAGSWTTRTEGSGNDYIVVEDGVRYITNTPAWKHKNVRATYKAGYTSTPTNVTQVSGRLAAIILQQNIDSSKQETVSVGELNVITRKANLRDIVLTDNMKLLLEKYRRVVYAFT